MRPDGRIERGRKDRAAGYTLSSGSLVDCIAGRANAGTAKDEDHRRMTAKVTVQEVERVAELAHLQLTPDETGHMLNDLNAILDYVAELNELDTANVVPLAQVSELNELAGASALRADQPMPSLDRAVVMPEAPESDQVFFVVPKVIER